MWARDGQFGIKFEPGEIASEVVSGLSEDANPYDHDNKRAA
jgi:hypothetical protein